MTDFHHERSDVLFEQARQLMPGGVSSPARACKSVGADPVFITRAEGPFLFDADDNRYIDFVCAFGPMILGHTPETVLSAVRDQMQHGLSYGAPTQGESTLAELLIEHVPSVDRVRLVNSGTEATMSCLRAARGFTGRAKIIKFDGCYHGHADFLLVKAGSGAMTLGAPNSAGVTEGNAKDTLTAPYNDLDAVRALFDAHGDDIAAIIVEPVPGNMGVVPAQPGFLEGLKDLCQQHGAVLVFDEVMSGFRVALGGAQQRLGVVPDMTCLGKIVGGGLPVGAYGGRADIMGVVAPDGPVYQAGTNSGNPLSVAAGVATLKQLASGGVYDTLEQLGARFQAGLEKALSDTGVEGCVQRIGSMLTLFFHPGPVVNADDITLAVTEKFGRFWRGMRERGVYLPPSQYEAWFISATHSEALIDEAVEAARDTLAGL